MYYDDDQNSGWPHGRDVSDFLANLMAEVKRNQLCFLQIYYQSGVDIRQFNRANLMPPGVYSVDIY
ncbi:hypothetical protein ACNKHR_12655 [Shigella flexneri]